MDGHVMKLYICTGLAVFFTAAFSAAFVSGPAYAGGCPEEHKLAEPRELKRVGTTAVGRQVLAEVDLTGWREMGNFKLRTRRLIIDVNGVVPTHSHGDRPSIVYILSGELVEHNALCAVPIVHKTGDVAPESGAGTVHWWENTSDAPAVVLSSDVVPFKAPDTPDM